MKNKVLVEIVVPELDESYDVYIPVNKKVGNIIELVNKALKEVSNGTYINNNKKNIYNVLTGNSYDMDILVRNTDIRNGTILIIV